MRVLECTKNCILSVVKCYFIREIVYFQITSLPRFRFFSNMNQNTLYLQQDPFPDDFDAMFVELCNSRFYTEISFKVPLQFELMFKSHAQKTGTYVMAEKGHQSQIEAEEVQFETKEPLT